MEDLIRFMKSQKLWSIACNDRDKIWIVNVYVGVSDLGILYFVSPLDTRHGKIISINSRIAFATACSIGDNPNDRKGIQGNGICEIVTEVKELTVGLMALHSCVPGLARLITTEWLLNNAFGSRLCMVKADYIKYWDDELFGEKEFAEFHVKQEKNRGL